MRISLIVATDLDGVIGQGNRIPWHLPADLRRFRKLTLGKPVIMGSKTFASIGKPLAKRQNIVMTQRAGFDVPGCEVARSPEEALELAGGAPEVMVIGGAIIYELFVPLADRIYQTIVDSRFPGDTRFPKFDREEWREVSREECPSDAKNPHAHSFTILERI